MDTFTELRARARSKRDRAIAAANEEYAATVKQISTLSHLIAERGVPRERNRRAMRLDDRPFNELCLSECVAVVLRDSQLTLTELTLEIQRRGNRTDDDHRKVAHAIRGTLLYHRERYKRDKAGRWAAVQ